MARARNIKPGFFTNDQLADLDPYARLLFIGLWTVADREGRLEDRPKKIKAEILPFDDVDVDALLTALASHGFIVRYVADTLACIEVVNFVKHQNPHPKEKPSEIPESHVKTRKNVTSHGKQRTSRVMQQTSNASSLTSSLNPSSLNPESTPSASNDAIAMDEGNYSVEFMEFWNAYPKKVGKSVTFNRWKQLKPSRALIDKMLAAIEAQKHGRKWREGYVMDPVRWLKEGHWEDEVDTEQLGSLRVMNGGRPYKPTTAEVVDEFRAWAKEQQDDEPNVIEAKAVTR